jgi:uncharacterized spore protein YtfJ
MVTAMDVNDVMSKVNSAVSAQRAFGPAYEHDGCTVIPAALVIGGGGAGEPPAPIPAPTTKVKGPGPGGGFGVVSWPIGAYVIKDGQVRWVPAVNPTLLAAIAALMLRSLVKWRTRRALPPA